MQLHATPFARCCLTYDILSELETLEAEIRTLFQTFIFICSIVYLIVICLFYSVT